MRHLLRKILEDIKRGENIDLLVIVALALVISTLNSLGIASEQIISSITLATLGLIAVGLLINRYKMDEIYKETDVKNTVHFLAHKPSSFENDLASAKEIWMVGLILRGTTSDNFYNFKNKVGHGTKLRVLIANPNKIDMSNVVERFSRASNVVQFKSDFEQTINQYYQIRQSATTAENVQLKLLDFVPSYSLYIFPRAKNGDVAYVEMYGYRSPNGSIPKFRITKQSNPEWFAHFLDQFEMMWQDAVDGI